MENKNLYEILGLKPNSTKEEIKIAYRKLVRIYHPDINKTKEAENYFKLLNNAVETLLDDAKRLQYDTLAGLSAPKKNYVENEGEKNDEVFKNGDKIKEDNSPQNKAGSVFFGYKTKKTKENTGFFKNENLKNKPESEPYAEKTSKTRPKGPKLDGKDIETIVTISKKEQKQGSVRKINVLHTDKCPKCAGAKYINGTVCALCRGAGEKSEHKIMNVKIPAGISRGTKMKIEGEGEYGKFGGKNGDLYLLIEIEKEISPNNEENSPVIEARISPWQAVLGGKINVNVEGKNVSINIPPLTKSTTRFKLKKEDNDFASLGLNTDYIIIIRIDIKENFTEKEIDLYKKLREIDLGLNIEKQDE